MSRKVPPTDDTDEPEEKLNSAVADRLLWLEKEHGTLTPQIVVQDAMNPNSVLHAEFEWDTDVAAMRHWITRARKLIASVRVEIRTSRHNISAIGFLHDPSLPPNVAGYRSIETLRKSKRDSREALRQECLRASAAMRRAREVAVALDLENECEAILAEILNLMRAA